MNIAELMLIACCVLGIVVLIIVAIDEPKYTWRQIATFDEKLIEMQKAFDNIARAIGEKLIPAFRDAVLSFDEASKVFEKFSESRGSHEHATTNSR